MIVEYYTYFSKNFGEAHANVQIRIGRASDGQIMSYTELTAIIDDNRVIIETEKEAYYNFLRNCDREDYYRESSLEEFAELLQITPAFVNRDLSQ